MANPTLKRTSVQIKYSSSDGFRFEYGAKAGKGTKHRVTGEEVPPQLALLDALEELARLTALFGFEAEALKKFNGARACVAEWKASRTPPPGHHTMSLARVEVGLPVQAYPHKAWDRIPKGVKLEDLWQLCGPQVDKHMQSLPLWKVFCLVYFEGIAHGAGAERARADRESQGTEGTTP